MKRINPAMTVCIARFAPILQKTVGSAFALKVRIGKERLNIIGLIKKPVKSSRT